MFEMEYGRIKQFAAKSKKICAAFDKECKSLKLQSRGNFPGKDTKTPAELA